MLPQTTKPTNSESKTLDRELRDMVNAITSRVAELHKPGDASSHHHHGEADEDEHGIRIVTLAGNNAGATMRTDLDDKVNKPDGISAGEPDALGSFVNSNFQAVNNSIMLGSSHNTNDPGVHMEIADTFEQHHGHKPLKHEKKHGKKKEKDAFEGDHPDEHTD